MDDKFEEFMAEYDDENLGGLEFDEIEGTKNLLQKEHSETMKQIVDEYQKIREEERQKPPEAKEYSQTHLIESMENDVIKLDTDLLEIEDGDKRKEKWDCESILSTYSNLYNRPKVITEHRIKVRVILGPEEVFSNEIT